MSDIVLAQLKEALTYNPETGVFARASRRRGCRMSDKVGHVSSKDGYRRVYVDRKMYLAHRLAWLYVFGVWPAGDVDHIDGVRDNNKIKNLRDCSRAENKQNMAEAQSNNTCGLLGASFNKRRGNYQAQIHAGGVTHYLGSFSTAQEAHEVYLSAKGKLHTHTDRALTPSRS